MPLLRFRAPVVAAVLVASATDVQANPVIRDVVYAPDNSDFPNPERGFSRSKGSGGQARAAGLSLIHIYFRLDPFRDAALTATFIDSVEQRFAEARKSGVKVVPRFTYNFPQGDADPKIDEDAPLPRVLQHLDQLGPILRRNADVIAYVEAGFVGAWGEWHHSTSGLDSLDAKRAILKRLLEILPPSRDIALRYERDKRAIFARDIATRSEEAFSGTAISRVGHHNDCFLASADDMGTYDPTSSRPIATAKAYLAADNRYVPQGGETCSAGPDAQPYIGCRNALQELAYEHWSQLNSDYHRQVLDGWKREGCYSEIAKRLGYRFRLLSSTYPSEVKRGGLVRATITLINDGFAAPYNPRDLLLVLRRGDGRSIRLKLADDPRRWVPGAPIRLRLELRLPSGMKPGLYEAALALPDPAPRLRSRPEYAIRLANRGVWSSRTADNALNWQVQVR